MNRTRNRMSRISKKELATFEASERVNTKYGNYIVAQSPKACSTAEWIKLLFVQNVSLVVCLNELGDKDEYCSEWFETKPGLKKKVKNRYIVQTTSVLESLASSHYELLITNIFGEEGGNEKIVHVITLPLWRDVISQNGTTVALLLKDLFTLNATCSKGISPILVHGGCNARQTGSFVLLCMICKQLREHGTGSLIACINLVRKHKSGLVKDSDLFAMVLQSILDFSIEDGITHKNSKTYQQACKLVRDCSAPPRKSNAVVYL